jgi:Trk-type K+ transport system membrane component
MRWHYISGIVSLFLLVLPLNMAVPLMGSLYYVDGAHFFLIGSMAITAGAGLIQWLGGMGIISIVSGHHPGYPRPGL